METVIALFFLLAIVVGTSDKPSGYYPLGQDGGYSESILDRNLVVSRFDGNSSTPADDPFYLSQFRAYEYCFKQGKIAFILKIENASKKETVYRTSAVNFDNVAFGNTRTDSIIYPAFDTYFLCAEDIFLLDVKLRNVSKEDMKTLVSDLMGGTQVVDVMENSPNKGILNHGDIIFKINDRRIEDDLDLFDKVNKLQDHGKLTATIIRNGKPIFLNLTASNRNPEYLKEIKQNIVIACNNKRFPELKKRPICTSIK